MPKPVKVLKRLEKLMPKFLDHQNKNLENLELNFAAKNFHEIARIGHIIKGSAGSYGFDELTDIGNAIEMAAKNQNLNDTQSGINKYRDYIKNINFEFVDKID